MGIVRAVIAWLAVSTLGLVSGLPHVTLADDGGPGKEVRTIRHDLPLLLAAQRQGSPVPASVDAVVVENGLARAQWHTARTSGTAHLSYRLDRWWMLCETPSEQDRALLYAGRIRIPSEAYNAGIVLAANDAPRDAAFADLRGRAPTPAESWVTSSGNGYFYFSGTVASSAPIHVQGGSTVDVWFPFVLDPSLFYALTIAHADKPIGPIDGTLSSNVVRFVLPAFTLPPGATLMAEIDGDPFRH